jgi:hypothetical protein
MAEWGLVNVEIIKKGEGPFSDEVKIRTTRGDLAWVPARDVIARKIDPEVPG